MEAREGVLDHDRDRLPFFVKWKVAKRRTPLHRPPGEVKVVTPVSMTTKEVLPVVAKVWGEVKVVTPVSMTTKALPVVAKVWGEVKVVTPVSMTTKALPVVAKVW
jgi:hypothetical protein